MGQKKSRLLYLEPVYKSSVKVARIKSFFSFFTKTAECMIYRLTKAFAYHYIDG